MMKKTINYRCDQCANTFEDFYSKLSLADYAVFMEHKKVVFKRRREIIFEEGKQAQGLYCIYEGKVKIFKNGLDGREQITRIAIKGEILGIKALLSGHPYSVSATALEPTTLCIISKNDFFYLTLRYPDFTKALVTCLAQLLQDAENKMISLAHKQVRVRLAETLILLNPNIGMEKPDPPPYLNITRNDLANLIGTSTETLIRSLAEFKNSGMISIKGRKIFIEDASALKKIAQMTS
jgi:CRP/FNR family transcriptional regulator